MTPRSGGHHRPRSICRHRDGNTRRVKDTRRSGAQRMAVGSWHTENSTRRLVQQVARCTRQRRGAAPGVQYAAQHGTWHSAWRAAYSTQRVARGAWHTAHGTVHSRWHTVCGAWYVAQYIAHGTRYVAHGTWHTAHGMCHTARGTVYSMQRTAHGTARGVQCVARNPQHMAHGTWHTARGTWHRQCAGQGQEAGAGAASAPAPVAWILGPRQPAAAQQGSRLLRHNLKAVAAQKYRSFKAPALSCTLPVTNPPKYRGSWSARRQRPCGQPGLGDTSGSRLLPAAWWDGEGHEGGRAAPRELPVPLPAPR